MSSFRIFCTTDYRQPTTALAWSKAAEIDRVLLGLKLWRFGAWGPTHFNDCHSLLAHIWVGSHCNWYFVQKRCDTIHVKGLYSWETCFLSRKWAWANPTARVNDHSSYYHFFWKSVSDEKKGETCFIKLNALKGLWKTSPASKRDRFDMAKDIVMAIDGREWGVTPYLTSIYEMGFYWNRHEKHQLVDVLHALRCPYSLQNSDWQKLSPCHQTYRAFTLQYIIWKQSSWEKVTDKWLDNIAIARSCYQILNTIMTVGKKEKLDILIGMTESVKYGNEKLCLTNRSREKQSEYLLGTWPERPQKCT